MSRGNFTSEEEAHAWAKKHLEGNPYEVKKTASVEKTATEETGKKVTLTKRSSGAWAFEGGGALELLYLTRAGHTIDQFEKDIIWQKGPDKAGVVPRGYRSPYEAMEAAKKAGYAVEIPKFLMDKWGKEIQEGLDKSKVKYKMASVEKTAFVRPWTIWKFISPSSGKTVIKPRPSEPGEKEYEHDFQQRLGVVNATSAEKALEIYERKNKKTATKK